MDDFLSGPRLEKRLMPLLDVALSLVGVLILMVSISNEQRDSGIEGNVATIVVRQDGQVMFGDAVLATTEFGVDDAVMNSFFEELKLLDTPLVLMYYTRPSDKEQFIEETVINTCIRAIEEKEIKLKVIGRDSGEGVAE